MAPFIWTVKPDSISGSKPVFGQPGLAAAEKNILDLASVVSNWNAAVFDHKDQCIDPTQFEIQQPCRRHEDTLLASSLMRPCKRRA